MLIQIPNYSNYHISPSGKVFNLNLGAQLQGSVNPAGYVNFRLTGDDGKVLTWGRHRLLAYVFLNPGKDISDLYVNHKNGIKGDDRLVNLEWVTPQENVFHAGENGLTAKCIPVEIRDVKTGEIDRFPSATAAAEASGLTKDAILWRLKSPGKLFPELKQYKAEDDLTQWPEYTEEEIDVFQFGNSKALTLKDVVSNSVQEFDSCSALSKYLKVLPSTVTLWLSKKGQPLILGKYLVKFKSDTSPWRHVGDLYLEMERSTGKRAVVAYSENDVKIFSSAVECSKAMNLKPTALQHRLRHCKNPIFSDGYRYRYYSDYIVCLTSNC